MHEGRDTSSGRQGRPVNADLTPAILDAVLSLLAEGGYAGLTTAATAQRAGVSTATLYRRWTSKRDLVLAAAEQLADAESADVDTGTTDGDLRELLTHKQRVLSGAIGATLVALVGESAHDAELAGVLRASVMEPTREHLAAILSRARTRGEAVDAGPGTAADLIVGMILSRIAFGGVNVGDLFTANDATMLVNAITGHSGRQQSDKRTLG